MPLRVREVGIDLLSIRKQEIDQSEHTAHGERGDDVLEPARDEEAGGKNLYHDRDHHEEEREPSDGDEEADISDQPRERLEITSVGPQEGSPRTRVIHVGEPNQAVFRVEFGVADCRRTPRDGNSDAEDRGERDQNRGWYRREPGSPTSPFVRAGHRLRRKGMVRGSHSARQFSSRRSQHVGEPISQTVRHRSRVRELAEQPESRAAVPGTPGSGANSIRLGRLRAVTAGRTQDTFPACVQPPPQ